MEFRQPCGCTRWRALALCTGLFSTSLAAENVLPTFAAHALDLVAPRDRWVARAELRHTWFDQVYDGDGVRHPFGYSYDGLELDAALVPSLALLGPGASLGTTGLQAEASFERLELTFGYGVTDDLTLGVILPLGRARTEVDFAVSGGNVGWNPAFDPGAPVGPGNFPFAPVGMGAAEALGTAGVQRVLTDPTFGYRYRPVGSTQTTQLGDPTFGGLWRFHRSERAAATLGLGLRAGLADEDPDDLFDIPIDDGSDDVVGQIEYFRDLGANVDLRLLVKRTWQTPDRVEARVPVPGTALAPAASKEKLKRDLGDFWEYDIEIGRRFGDWRVSGTWHRYDKARDTFSSPTGQDTAALETGTNHRADQWRIALSWSGVRHWREGRLPLPLIAKLELQETWAGRNMNDVRDLYLVLTTLF